MWINSIGDIMNVVLTPTVLEMAEKLRDRLLEETDFDASLNYIIYLGLLAYEKWLDEIGDINGKSNND